MIKNFSRSIHLLFVPFLCIWADLSESLDLQLSGPESRQNIAGRGEEGPAFCQSLKQSRHEWSLNTQQLYSQFCKDTENDQEFLWQGPCDTTDPEILASRLKRGGTYDCRIMARNVGELSENFVDYLDEAYVKEAKPLTCGRDCQGRVKEIQSAFRRHNNIGKGRIYFGPMAPEYQDPQDFDKYNEKPTGPVHITPWGSNHGGVVDVHNSRTLPILVRIPGDRLPREVPDQQSSNEIFGKSYRIKCMPRNSESDQDLYGRYRTLCRSCWFIRTLPSKYFPKYLNENVCDGGKCLSSQNDTYGACRQQTMQMDVLKNLGSAGCPTWQKQKLTVRTGCACTARAFSENMMEPADSFFRVFLKTPSGA